MAVEVRQLLNEHNPRADDPRRREALHAILQYLARDLAGRDATPEECEYVCQGGERALDEILVRYEREHLRAHDSLFIKNLANHKERS